MLEVACVNGLSHDLLLLDDDDVSIRLLVVVVVQDVFEDAVAGCVATVEFGVVEIRIFSMPRSANTSGVVGRKIWPRCGFNASNGGDVRKFTGANK